MEHVPSDSPEAGAARADEDDPQVPPNTSEQPTHEEQVGGRGAEDPSEMADEDRYRKGPGW